MIHDSLKRVGQNNTGWIRSSLFLWCAALPDDASASFFQKKEKETSTNKIKRGQNRSKFCDLCARKCPDLKKKNTPPLVVAFVTNINSYALKLSKPWHTHTICILSREADKGSGDERHKLLVFLLSFWLDAGSVDAHTAVFLLSTSRIFWNTGSKEQSMGPPLR